MTHQPSRTTLKYRFIYNIIVQELLIQNMKTPSRSDPNIGLGFGWIEGFSCIRLSRKKELCPLGHNIPSSICLDPKLCPEAFHFLHGFSVVFLLAIILLDSILFVAILH